jgi:hypothetical protein
MIDQSLLKSLLRYDRETGEFFWLHFSGRRGKAVPGSKAGSTGKRGYIYIGIAGHSYQAHRLAWLYVHGSWPDNLIDHINGDPLDNRICNLRLCDHSLNMANRGAPANNTSGVKGVVWDRSRGKWAARICVNYKTINLGRFDNIGAAASAYSKAASRYFGEFGRDGNEVRS